MEDQEKSRWPGVVWRREEQTMTLEGEPVLRYSLNWPELEGRGFGVRWINRYYVWLVRSWRERWQREVYWRACLDLVSCRGGGRHFETWTGSLSGEVTLWERGLLSLRFAGEERHGRGKPNRVRWGDVWKVKEGAPCPAKEIFSGRRGWKRELTERVVEQGEARRAAGDCFLLPNWEKRVARTLPTEDFCLIPDGIELAFPQCTIAPAAEGTPVFCVSVEKTGEKQPVSDTKHRFKKIRRKKKNYP